MTTNNSTNSSLPISISSGGTGLTSTSPFSVVCGGTTSTNALQSIPSLGTLGQVLTSNGSGSLPSWSAAGSGTVTSVGSTIGLTGGAITSSGSLGLDLSYVMERAPCQYTTTANLSAVYNNGNSGVGATLTSTAYGAFTTDGSTPSLNSRILVRNQTTASQNGIYVLTYAGTSSTGWILTRASDFDGSITGSITQGSTVFVQSGNAFSLTSWMQVTAAPITVGTTSINFNTSMGFKFTVLGSSLATYDNSPFIIQGSNVQLGYVPNVGVSPNNSINLGSNIQVYTTTSFGSPNVTSATIKFYDGQQQNYIGLTAPTSGLPNASLTLPAQLPSGNQLLVGSSSGQMSWSNTIPSLSTQSLSINTPGLPVYLFLSALTSGANGGGVLLNAQSSNSYTTNAFFFQGNSNAIAPICFMTNPSSGTATYLGITAPTGVSLPNASYTLPGAFPTSGQQIMACNSSGVMSWITPQSNTWSNGTATSYTLAPANSYMSNSTSLVTYSLPSSSSIGDTYTILGVTSGGWKIAQNASQNIQFYANSTTVGTGGYLASSNQYDTVTLVCTVANTTWGVTASGGNITVV